MEFGYSTGLVSNYLESINRSTLTSVDMSYYISTGFAHRFYTNAIERLRIDASGNVGIGTTSPLAKLQVSSGRSYLFSGDNYSVGLAQTAAQANYMYLGTASDGTFYISESGGTARFTVQQAGNVGIGTTSPAYKLDVSGSMNCSGALSKGSGSFRIEHPLPEKSATHQLVHSFIEGPQADLIYRGKVVLVDGKASVNIDAAATMTEGTFEVLCREVQCFTTNESGWTAVRGKVAGNILTIEAKDADCSDEISWMVIGERQDPHMMETDWTDDNGKVIVEPLKPSIESN
jgi:hypothetical protein